MATRNQGFGSAPLAATGTNPCIMGFGVPAQADALKGNFLENSAGVPQESRMIDPDRLDYVMDANGILTGTTTIQTQVYLYVKTTIGSSTISTLGNEFWNLRTIDPTTYSRQVQALIVKALQNILSSGAISLVDVIVFSNKTKPVMGLVEIKYTDNTTGNQESVLI